jgi:tetratricopeptide (TPR) repeat protein
VVDGDRGHLVGARAFLRRRSARSAEGGDDGGSESEPTQQSFLHGLGSSANALRVVVAAGVVLVALDGGSYSLESRHSLAVGLFWGLALALALGLIPRGPVPRPAFVALLLLAGGTAWTGLSATWAASEEAAFAELGRSALYLGIVAATVLAARPGSARAWSDGIAIGIVGVAVAALVSRFFPDALEASSELPLLLPDAESRLYYPVNYWNGLGILTALAFPLLLAAAVRAGPGVASALALAPVPALAATVYLTSSRTAVAATVVSTVALVALARRRWAAAGAVALAAAGSAVAIAILAARPELVDDPADPAAVAQGRSAAVLLVLVCLAVGGAWAILLRLRPRQPSRRTGYAAIAAVVIAAAVAAAAADPVERVRDFTQPYGAGEAPTGVRSHLTSASGNARWQEWETALDQFAEHPLLGGGAGSYGAWWAEHGSLPITTTEAHSLYVEALGELGLIGLLLLAGAFVVALAAGALRSRAGDAAAAGLTAAFVGYSLGAGVDWMWELTAVSVVGMALLGLLVGPATAAPAALLQEVGRAPRLALAAAALALAVAAAIPLLKHVELEESRDAAADGRTEDAVESALRARSIEPWAASPALQLALVYERADRLGEARRWIGEALERDHSDWRIWLVAARIEARAGRAEPARAALARAIELNPRSPLFAGLATAG